jgi:hypothetical protein
MLSDSEREFISSYVRLTDPKARIAEYIRLGLPGSDKKPKSIQNKINAFVGSIEGSAAVAYERNILLMQRRQARKSLDTADYEAAKALTVLRKTVILGLRESIELEQGRLATDPSRLPTGIAKLYDVALQTEGMDNEVGTGVNDPVRMENLARKALGGKKPKPPEDGTGKPDGLPAPPPPVPESIAEPAEPDFQFLQPGEEARA